MTGCSVTRLDQMLGGNPMPWIARLHQVQSDRGTRSQTITYPGGERDTVDECPDIIGHHSKHHTAELIGNRCDERGEFIVQRGRHVQIALATLSLQQLAKADSSDCAADHRPILFRDKLDISGAHLVATRLPPVPIPTDIRKIDITSGDRLPRASSAQRTATSIRHLPPRVDRIARNRPRVAKPDPREITRNDELADTLGRHAKKCRRVREREQVRSHGNNILEYSNIYNQCDTGAVGIPMTRRGLPHAVATPVGLSRARLGCSVDVISAGALTDRDHHIRTEAVTL